MAWQIDNAHSEITFKVRHLMISSVSGSFSRFKALVDFDENKLEAAQIAVEIDPASITTYNADRDNHLKTADFFDVATYPKITFKSTDIVMAGHRKGYVTGNLTMHGVTQLVTLDVEYLGKMKNPASGATAAVFTAATKIIRKDWDLAWNIALEAGGVMVGEEVSINIVLELVQVAQPEVAEHAAV